MDKNERERLRALAKTATLPPWRTSMTGYSIKSGPEDPRIIGECPGGTKADTEAFERWMDNAEFIAAARTALPCLLDLVDSLLVAGDLVYREAMNGNAWVNFAGPHGSDLCICFDPDTAEKWGPPVRPEKHDEACTEFRTAIYTWRDTVAALKEPK